MSAGSARARCRASRRRTSTCIPAKLKDPDAQFLPVFLVMIGLAYNPAQVSEADAPRTIPDFLKPAFKGKIVSTYPHDDDLTLYSNTLIVEKYGWEMIEKLLKQDMKFVRSHVLVAQETAKGERPVTFDQISQFNKVRFVAPDDLPMPVYPITTGIFAKAPHPNAAKLFLAFAISKEQQQRTAASGAMPVRPDVEPPAGLKPLSDYRIADGYIAFISDERPHQGAAPQIRRLYRQAARRLYQHVAQPTAEVAGAPAVARNGASRILSAMAVYTDVSAEDLGAFLADYDLGELLSYKGIAEGVENSNFLVHTGTGHYILTLYEKRVAAGDLPFFLALMEHLAARGITCPQPVKDRSGETLGTLCGRPAAIVTFLDGMWMRRPDAGHCAAVGEALARMHLAGADFAGTAAQRALGRGLAAAVRAGGGARRQRAARACATIIEQELGHLEKAWPRDLPQGVIHADLFPDNVFFLGDKLSGLIDFYFACTDTLAYDVAICLNAWCFEPDHSYNVTKGRNLLHAYISDAAAVGRRARRAAAAGARRRACASC